MASANARRHPPSKTVSAKNLCDRLAKITKMESSMIDYLVSLDTKGQAQRLYPSRVPPQDESLTTLQHQLTMEGGEIRMYSSGHLAVKDCLSLAIVLLLAVLKYRLTPWLLSPWRSNNIYLIQRAKSLSRSDLTQPFLKSGFRSGDSSDFSQTSSTILFEVGVMLLEIVHGNSFA